MKTVIGADIGTGGTKAILYEERLTPLAQAVAAYGLCQPQNGWAEQPPEAWHRAVIACCKELVAMQPTAAASVKAIGLSGQMHGLVLLDRNRRPLMQSLLWCDTRADTECTEIRERFPEYERETLNAPVVGFCLPKLLWVKKHLPELYVQIDKVLLPKDYVNFCLTGVFATDVSDASGTGFFDVANRRWSRPILDAFDLSPEWLPTVFESGQAIGELLPEVREEIGLPNGVIVCAGAGDQAAAALGNGITHSGDCSLSLGSSGVVFAATEAPVSDPKGRVHSFCHAIPGRWHVMGVTQGAGLSVKWFKEQLGGGASYRELDASVDATVSRPLLYLPYLNGERTPHLDSFIRGAFIGLSAASTRSDLYRAVLEGVCFSLRDGYEIMQQLGLCFEEMIACGGGAKSPLWLRLLAAVLRHPIRVHANAESGTRGAAVLAWVAAGVFPNAEAVLRQAAAEESPAAGAETVAAVDPALADYYDRLYPLYRELYPLLADHNKKLQEIR